MKSALTIGAALLGLASLSSCKDPEPENFGTIKIELAPAAGKVEVFAGTTQVVATVNYQTCLQDFYLLDRTEYQKDGPEGSAVFQEFADKLCADYDEVPDCTVEIIDQALLENTDVYNLKVTYTITDPDSLAYSEMHVGPIPTEDFAGCKPIVELRQNGLVGRNSLGEQIWRISTLPGSNVATTNQGAPLRVEIIAQNAAP